MRLALRTLLLETERRQNWRELFDAQIRPDSPVIGAFLSLRNDDQFVWIERPGTQSAAIAAAFETGRRWIVSESTRPLEASPRSTVSTADDLASLSGSAVIEIRQYRLAEGVRRRFTDFLIDRTLDAQRECGMSFFGPFDDLDDENVATWFRGFPSLAERDRRKAAFYQGRLWLEELESVAMPMIEDYSNTMLVTPV
jgi:hypothetical protein